ncbi:hypothetical protein FHN55_05305 [Streptomyces sp. NP160]|uniref:hypothetical protein n=1 Tax=Streptomyces sp. NP160 TaxID=2586637 RepID=UPI00111AFFD5|nr:hypothetical protein [Streptomyces sp. NP160]TNM69195.1 hypothetical protein FHN55_05305 [Streptomyces sp. NP160]
MSTARGRDRSAGPDVEALQAACEQLVRTAADPSAARALVVRVWALGAAAADDLLLDLCDVAASSAARTGAEPSAADLLDALGRHDAAGQLRTAVDRGVAEHREAGARAARAERAADAARAVVRIATVTHHRRVRTSAA